MRRVERDTASGFEPLRGRWRRYRVSAIFGWLLLALAGLAAGCVSSRAGCPGAGARSSRGPRVLCVLAHPDDETTFAVTLYKIATELEGAVDVLVVTNGEGGFRYSVLAERIYGLPLTEESVGRAHLPAIRRHEMREACRILGVRDVTFLDERDHRYTQDPQEVLAPAAGIWRLERIRSAISQRLREGGYDVLLTLLPLPDSHGHHQAVARLALEVVRALPPAQRPLVLGAVVHDRGKNPVTGEALVALERSGGDGLLGVVAQPSYMVDRTKRFGFRHRLDYRIIARWVIAAHKSQGALQMQACTGEIERFWRYRTNRPDAAAKATALFASLARVPDRLRRPPPMAR